MRAKKRIEANIKEQLIERHDVVHPFEMILVDMVLAEVEKEIMKEKTTILNAEVIMLTIKDLRRITR